jgi:hypothetical protein
MKIFIKYQYSDERLSYETSEKTKVRDLVDFVKNYYNIAEIPAYENVKDKSVIALKLKLYHFGGELNDDCLFNELAILEGSTLKCLIIEEIIPEFYVYIKFKKELYKFYDSTYQMISYTVYKLRLKLSDELGLPLSIFRMKSGDIELQDNLRLIDYNIQRHGYVQLETWLGWDSFLNNCIKGFTKQVVKTMNNDELIRQYQARVALYIASHYDHIDLAHRLVRLGARPDKPVGVHPNKQWEISFKNSYLKPEYLKCPIHVAVLNAHMKLVSFFIGIGTWMLEVRDGFGISTWRLALRNLSKNQKNESYKHVVRFILSHNHKYKLIRHLLVSNMFLYRLMIWKEKAKERVLIKYGLSKSSLKKRPFLKGGLVGYNTLVSGYNNNFKESINTYDGAKAKSQQFYPFNNEEKLRLRHLEDYFRKLNTVKAINQIVNEKPKNPESKVKKLWKRIVMKQIQINLLNRHAYTLENLGISLKQYKLPRENQDDDYYISNFKHESLPETKKSNFTNNNYRNNNKKLLALRSLSENKHYYKQPVPKSRSSIDVNLPLLNSYQDSTNKQTTCVRLKTENKSLVLKPNLNKDENFTMKHYLKLCSGLTPRETAEKCLESANTFKQKSWLKQLRLSDLMLKRVVKRRIDLKETSI